MTVKELHLKVDMYLQHINSNRKQSIAPEYIDMAINEAIIQKINTKFSPQYDPRQSSFEDNFKRYDDLEVFKKTIIVPVIYDHTGSVFNAEPYIVKPSDYLRYVSVQADIDYNKSQITALFGSQRKYIYQITIPLDNSNNAIKYESFELKFGTYVYNYNAVYNNKYILRTTDARFMIISDLIDELKINNINAYWEYYDSHYTKNTLYIISDEDININDIYVRYNNANYAKSKTSKNYNILSNVSNLSVPTELVSSEYLNFIKVNPYYKRFRHNKPLCYIENNRIRFIMDKTFLIKNVKITYLEIPIKVNYVRETMPKINFDNELLVLVVEKLKMIILHDGYNAQVKENLITE